MYGVAREFSDALNSEVTYSDIPPDDWERELKRQRLPEHLTLKLLDIITDKKCSPAERLVVVAYDS
jgi:hypothetical protein